MASKREEPGPRGGNEPADGSLRERYRTILIDRLSRKDLEELQSYLRHEFDERGNLDRQARDRFEFRLRQFLHEEVLTREFVGIEALIRDLRPEDLKR